MKGFGTSILAILFVAMFLASAAPVGVPGGFNGVGEEKVTICHVPPGNPSNAHTISVNETSVQGHLDHGDTLGACGEGVTPLEAEAELFISGLGFREFVIQADGPTVVTREEADQGDQTFETEIVSMQLTGSSPLGNVTVKVGRGFGLPPSEGLVRPVNPGTQFPAESFFDVFIEIEIPGTVLRTFEPFKIQTIVPDWPPIGVKYNNTPSQTPVPMVDEAGNQVGFLLGAILAFSDIQDDNCDCSFLGVKPRNPQVDPLRWPQAKVGYKDPKAELGETVREAVVSFKVPFEIDLKCSGSTEGTCDGHIIVTAEVDEFDNTGTSVSSVTTELKGLKELPNGDMVWECRDFCSGDQANQTLWIEVDVVIRHGLADIDTLTFELTLDLEPVCPTGVEMGYDAMFKIKKGTFDRKPKLDTAKSDFDNDGLLNDDPAETTPFGVVIP